VLNIYYLDETLEFFYNNFSRVSLYLNLVHGPDYYNISNMPNSIKNVVGEKLTRLKQQSWLPDDAANQVDGIKNFMFSNTIEDSTWDKFKSTLSLHDSYRKENYYETFPEFGELIKAK
jgi:hypothetical protein